MWKYCEEQRKQVRKEEKNFRRKLQREQKS